MPLRRENGLGWASSPELAATSFDAPRLDFISFASLSASIVEALGGRPRRVPGTVVRIAAAMETSVAGTVTFICCRIASSCVRGTPPHTRPLREFAEIRRQPPQPHCNEDSQARVDAGLQSWACRRLFSGPKPAVFLPRHADALADPTMRVSATAHVASASAFSLLQFGAQVDSTNTRQRMIQDRLHHLVADLSSCIEDAAVRRRSCSRQSERRMPCRARFSTSKIRSTCRRSLRMRNPVRRHDRAAPAPAAARRDYGAI